MFSGSLANYISNSGNRTDTGLPVIDYSLTLISLPLLMSMAVLGVTFNHYLPESVLCVVLVYVLQNSTLKTYKKLRDIYAKENREIAASTDVELQEALRPAAPERPARGQSGARLQELLAEEQDQYPV